MKTSMKRSKVLSLLLAAVMVVGVAITGCGQTAPAPTASTASNALKEYWAADSQAAESLRNYVAKVTNEKDTENFIPVKDRIAVFDMDGTLIDSMWMWKQIDIDYLARFGIELPENLQELFGTYLI